MYILHVRPTFNECFINSTETRKTFFFDFFRKHRWKITKKEYHSFACTSIIKTLFSDGFFTVLFSYNESHRVCGLQSAVCIDRL